MMQQSDDSLMAIVSIDLSGYGLLMEKDEAGTHQAVMACLRTILEPTMTDWHGRIVKSTSDGARDAIERFDALSLERRNWSSHHLPYVLSWPFRYDRDRLRLYDGIEQAGIKP